MRNPPATVTHAVEQISRLTGVDRKPTQVRHFLKHLGMKPRKMAAIPAKANPQVQQKFLEEKLMPQLEQAKAGSRKVFFADASHFVLAPFLGLVWCFTRIFVKAPSGRQRFNVLGALDAVSKELSTVCNDTYITAQQVCQLLDKLKAQNMCLPITVVLDNARYQHCSMVEEHARSLKIDLLFLPSYSPNLNLIERFWKFVKKDCLYSKYYSAFADFKQAISICIAQAPIKHKKELHSLLTLRFQTFENLTATVG